MGSLEKSKKGVHLWKKTVFHFILCFIIGFFIGIVPSSKPSITSTTSLDMVPSNQSDLSPHPTKMLIEKDDNTLSLNPQKLLIIITPTSTKHGSQTVVLRRLADTLRLVGPPLLWIVIEKSSDSSEMSELLRETGIMYRHLVYDESFVDLEGEMDHQRNTALNHIEHHRLSGIVHFAGLDNVYDLRFFDEIRHIEVFGTWPMASVSANRKNVIIEGPICNYSQVIGWHLKNKTKDIEPISPFHISSFAFNSSILWDPERWGRPSSIQDNSQNSIKFVKEVVLEDDTKLKGIPPEEDCSKIMIWHLNYQANNLFVIPNK